MKTKFSIFLLISILLGVFWIGCQEQLTEPTQQSSLYQQSLSKYVTDPSQCEKVANLYAGQNILVGHIEVCNDETNLYVNFVITDPEWCLEETHLALATALDGIPQTKKGNPIPGQFDYYHEDLNCASSDSYEILLTDINPNWVCGDDLFVATHAVVLNLNEQNIECIDFEAYEEKEGVNTVSTSAGDVEFYMTQSLPLHGLNIGDAGTFTPPAHEGDLYPIVATPATTTPGPSTLENIVAFTIFGDYTRDDEVADPNGTGAGGNTLTDPQDLSQVPLQRHAISKFLAIVVDVSNVDYLQDLNLVSIDMDHGEEWHFQYFNNENILIYEAVLNEGNVGYGDGKAFPVDYSNPEISKVAIWGGNNNGIAERIGYAIDNICITTVEEETAWGGEEEFPGKNWATYIVYESSCPPECKVYLSESFGGSNDGSIIYTVFLEENNAVLSEEIDLTGSTDKTTWDKPHLAVHPGTGNLYLMNNGNGNHLGVWDGTTLNDLGTVADLPNPGSNNPGTVLAAFSDGGDLYVANSSTNKIYQINIAGSPAVMKSWNSGISIQGADMAFIGDDLYLWTNTGKKLYMITSLNDDGTVEKVEVGSGSAGFTGLAYGVCTDNKLLGSSNTDNKLYEIDVTNGNTTSQYTFKLNNNTYNHIYGDMASGF